MVLGKTLHPVFSSCEVVLNPPNPHARRHPVTQIARERDRERESKRERARERDRLRRGASCFIQSGPPCCDSNN